MDTIMEPARRVPVLARADVVVVGGGSAGCVAAVAAARTGAQTVLLERYGDLGGMTTGTFNTSITALWDSDGNQTIRGIPWEVIQRLREQGAAIVREPAPGSRPGLAIEPEGMKRVALEMVREAGVDLVMHAWVAAPLMEDGAVKGVFVETKQGRVAVLGTVLVDASADADVAAGAGAPYEKLEAEELQQMSVDLTVANVDWKRVLEWARAHPDRVRGRIPEHLSDDDAPFGNPHEYQPPISFNIFPSEKNEPVDDTNEQNLHVHMGTQPTVKLLIRRGVARVQGSVEADGTDVRALTFGEVEGRKAAMHHLDWLRETVSGFEHAFVIGRSPLGVRETRRVIGDYWLTLEDFMQNRRFPDGVVRSARGLDRHLKGGRFEYQTLKGWVHIPYRSLLPRNVENLLVAGRCISADHAVNASTRGGGTCMATGHAAGTAAALAVEEGVTPRKLNTNWLRETLVSQDALI